jgi:hypothetical protein
LVLGRFVSQDLLHNLHVRHYTRLLDTSSTFDRRECSPLASLSSSGGYLTPPYINVISKKPNCITIPYVVIGVNGREFQYLSIFVLLDRDRKLGSRTNSTSRKTSLRATNLWSVLYFNFHLIITNIHHHHHHHKHPWLGHLARSVSRVKVALSVVSLVSQLFSFLVGCKGMILKGFGIVAFFAGVKASSFCIHLSYLVCSLSVVRGE